MVDRHEVAEVRLWGHRVGALALPPGEHTAVFEYDPDWRDQGLEIAPVTMGLSPKKFRFPGLSPETFHGLPGVFADTLPDDFGNAVINAWLASEGRDPADFSPIERLLYSGTRGMGALEFAPAIRRERASDQAVEMDALVGLAQRVLDERAGLKVALSDSEAGLQTMLQFGTSAGGARAKAVIGLNADRSQMRSGQSDLPDGFTHYLLKFDGVTERRDDQETFGDPKGYGRIEYAYSLMARDAGVDMMPCELLEEGGRAHFLTQRYDRIGNDKQHVQTLCAMAHADYRRPGEYAYEELFALMRSLRMPRSEALQMITRMVFNVIARNQDDHTKNTSFIMDKTGRWTLTPAYDIAFAYKPGSFWVDSHQMTIAGKRDQFTAEELVNVVPALRSDAEQILERVQDSVAQWPRFAVAAGVGGDVAEQLQKHFRKL